MPAGRLMAVLVALGALSLALAACSGGSGGSNKTQTASPNPELNAVAQKFAASTFKAAYTLTSTGGDQPLDGTMTMYKLGADKFRFDVKSTQDGQDVALTLIETKDASVFCLQDAGELAPILGVEPGKGVCFKSDPTNGAGGLLDITDAFKNLSSDNVTLNAKTTRTIAGQNGTCYQYTAAGSSDSDETCFSDGGVPLYDKTVTSADTTTLEATQLQGNAQDTDFNIPYEVKDFPTGGTP